MIFANDWVSVFILVVISAVFAGDAACRWWQANAWKRRLNRPCED